MSDLVPNQRLLPSLLDRLLDDDPGGPPKLPAPHHQVLSELKRSVCRDLENLLNTRTRFLRWPAALGELDRSLLRYGLPDFSNDSLVSQDDRIRFCKRIAAIIKENEPRLLTVSVEPLTQNEPIDRVLRIRIEGLLRVEPVPEPVVFDTIVKPATGDVQVTGATS